MSLKQFSLQNKVIILTGACGLLGRRYSYSLANAGANIAVVDLDKDSAEAFAGEISQVSGQDALGLGVDISQQAEVLSMVACCLAKWGRIDGLVNNAAINPKFGEGHGNEHVIDFESYPLAMFQQSLSVNVVGMFLCSQAVIPHMKKRGRGTIVNISSTYGLTGPDQRLYEKDDPNIPVSYKPPDYSVTKSATLGFTKYLAAYYGKDGIRVNTLTPGGVYNNHDAEFERTL